MPILKHFTGYFRWWNFHRREYKRAFMRWTIERSICCVLPGISCTHCTLFSSMQKRRIVLEHITLIHQYLIRFLFKELKSQVCMNFSGAGWHPLDSVGTSSWRGLKINVMKKSLFRNKDGTTAVIFVEEHCLHFYQSVIDERNNSGQPMT